MFEDAYTREEKARWRRKLAAIVLGTPVLALLGSSLVLTVLVLITPVARQTAMAAAWLTVAAFLVLGAMYLMWTYLQGPREQEGGQTPSKR